MAMKGYFAFPKVPEHPKNWILIIFIFILGNYCQVDRGCRIHRLHRCRRVKKTTYAYPGYDTKQSNGQALVMLEIWGMQSTPSLPSIPDPFCSRVVVAPYRVLFLVEKEIFHNKTECKPRTDAKLNCFK